MHLVIWDELPKFSFCHWLQPCSVFNQTSYFEGTDQSKPVKCQDKIPVQKNIWDYILSWYIFESSYLKYVFFFQLHIHRKIDTNFFWQLPLLRFFLGKRKYLGVLCDAAAGANPGPLLSAQLANKIYTWKIPPCHCWILIARYCTSFTQVWTIKILLKRTFEIS